MVTGLDQAVHAALSAALDPVSILLRQAYANPSPPPPGDQDVLYYHLEPEAGSPLTEQAMLSNGTLEHFRYAPYRLLLTFYGPRAEELAWRVFHRLYQDGYRQPRRLLREQGIYPLPRPSAPVLIWEEWEKQHRPRADLTLRLYTAVSLIDASPAAALVENPPEIPLHCC